jgi:hypothetical protein
LFKFNVHWIGFFFLCEYTRSAPVLLTSGGDEASQMVWSVIAESLREGLMGTAIDAAGIGIMENINNYVMKQHQEEITSNAT